MLVLVFALPLAAALGCLALNRSLPTRWVGVGSALALALAGGVLLSSSLRGGLPLALFDYPWTTFDERTVRLALRFDAVNGPFALLALFGGALGLLTLALAVPPDVRGFGGLFAALLFALLATLMGLTNLEPLLLPCAWSLAALAAFMALRASGALAGTDAPLIVLLIGMLGALSLLVVGLVQRPSIALSPVALICWTVAGLLAVGAPPFHALIQQPAQAPAALAGVLLAFGLPLLGGYMLVRYAAAQGLLPPSWSVTLTLLGLLTLLVCAGGATSTTRIRGILAWQLSGQFGWVLLAVAQGGATLKTAAPALLANTVVTTLTCFAALAPLERQTGTDDLAALTGQRPLLVPGLTFLVGAASAVGVPGTWGWWAHRWLLDDLLGAAPWAVPVLLAGSSLLALAYVAPLAAFWPSPCAQPAPEAAPRGLRWTEVVTSASPLIMALPLLILGIAPQVAWAGWLAPAQLALAPDVPAQAPVLPGSWGQILSAAAAGAMVILPVAGLRRGARRAVHDQEMQGSGVFTPLALGQSMRRLAWLATPVGLLQGLWDTLLTLSQATRHGLALFEQRYYMAGLMIALIIVILLFI